jgi:NCAIR mutase (PurE)-related protein
MRAGSPILSLDLANISTFLHTCSSLLAVVDIDHGIL